MIKQDIVVMEGTPMADTPMVQTDVEAELQSYLKAFEEHDLNRCLEFYADDSTIHFIAGVFKGKRAITNWHRDRFKANFAIKQIQQITINGNEAVIDAVIGSDRLKTWHLNNMRGTGTFIFRDGKIQEGRLKLAGYLIRGQK